MKKRTDLIQPVVTEVLLQNKSIQHLHDQAIFWILLYPITYILCDVINISSNQNLDELPQRTEESWPSPKRADVIRSEMFWDVSKVGSSAFAWWCPLLLRSLYKDQEIIWRSLIKTHWRSKLFKFSRSYSPLMIRDCRLIESPNGCFPQIT